jgi:hypothetical protein
VLLFRYANPTLIVQETALPSLHSSYLLCGFNPAKIPYWKIENIDVANEQHLLKCGSPPLTYKGGFGPLFLGSVANSWQNFSARSAKKFGRWQKNSPSYKIFSQMLILLSSTHYFFRQRGRKIKDIRRSSVLFCRYFKVFIWIISFKIVRPLFGPFLAYMKKIRLPIFPAAQIFVGPLLSYAAEISAPWQHCF